MLWILLDLGHSFCSSLLVAAWLVEGLSFRPQMSPPPTFVESDVRRDVEIENKKKMFLFLFFWKCSSKNFFFRKSKLTSSFFKELSLNVEIIFVFNTNFLSKNRE